MNNHLNYTQISKSLNICIQETLLIKTIQMFMEQLTINDSHENYTLTSQINKLREKKKPLRTLNTYNRKQTHLRHNCLSKQ